MLDFELWIDNEWVPASDGSRRGIVDPATEINQLMSDKNFP